MAVRIELPHSALIVIAYPQSAHLYTVCGPRGVGRVENTKGGALTRCPALCLLWRKV
jgi:hypothetical protein